MTRRARAIVLVTLVAAGLSAACSDSPSGPSRTAPPQAPSPPGATYTLSGRLVGTVTGEPIAGATVAVGSDTFVTDGDGAFTVTTAASNVRNLVISGDGLLTRETRLSVATRDVTVDVIQDRAPFDLAFFRAFARNGLSPDAGLEPLRPLRNAPRIHIRTVDEAGQPIDSRTLDLVESVLRDSAAGWSAGRFPLEVIERGPGTRQGQSGWVTVIFPSAPEGDRCGRATVGTTTGFIELQYHDPLCTCGADELIAPRTVRHELGHVYGYWHTSGRRDVMYGDEWSERMCDQRPSSRELDHAKYMYARTPGNLDPDTDPSGTILREPPVIVIDD